MVIQRAEFVNLNHSSGKNGCLVQTLITLRHILNLAMIRHAVIQQNQVTNKYVTYFYRFV